MMPAIAASRRPLDGVQVHGPARHEQLGAESPRQLGQEPQVRNRSTVGQNEPANAVIHEFSGQVRQGRRSGSMPRIRGNAIRPWIQADGQPVAGYGQAVVEQLGMVGEGHRATRVAPAAKARRMLPANEARRGPRRRTRAAVRLVDDAIEDDPGRPGGEREADVVRALEPAGDLERHRHSRRHRPDRLEVAPAGRHALRPSRRGGSSARPAATNRSAIRSGRSVGDADAGRRARPVDRPGSDRPRGRSTG